MFAWTSTHRNTTVFCVNHELPPLTKRKTRITQHIVDFTAPFSIYYTVLVSQSTVDFFVLLVVLVLFCQSQQLVVKRKFPKQEQGSVVNWVNWKTSISLGLSASTKSASFYFYFANFFSVCMCLQVLNFTCILMLHACSLCYYRELS